MKFTLSWLKEHLDTSATVEEITLALTKLGLEVEGVEDPAAKLRGFQIAKVLTAKPHPQADKLQVLEVDIGGGADPLQVVCGAPNARAGLVGVLGLPGGIVPANGMELRVSAIRGVESNGMMCSARELEIGEGHDGIIELPEDATIGESFAVYSGFDDPVIDISVTPNRQDCMGVRGVARDLAAAGIGTLKPLKEVYRGPIEPVTGTDPAPTVATLDPEGCPAFYAQAVSGVTNGASPEWMRRRLTAIGQKPISMLVDITNFVSVDLGRPLHVYDRARLSGPLVARKAKAGEQVLALNGKTYTLSAEMTVIADDVMVHDIGGIMGGEHSGVSDATTDVLIECAYFTPEAIARTGQKLALTSDARQRFERGVDPAFLDDGLAIATRLVLEHCGGKASAITRAGEAPTSPNLFKYEPAATLRLAGIEVAADRQREILASLGFVVDSSWTIVVPSWRRDIDGVADIVEEIVRVEGLDNVPSVPLPRPDGVARPTATPEQRTERVVRRAAASRGLEEAVTWSFIAPALADLFGGAAWTLANPISEDMKAMRPSLLPGLLAAAKRNADRGAGSIRLFELGRRYLADGEHPTVGLVLAGDRQARDWRNGKAVGFDAYDAKAEAVALLAAAGAPVDRLQVMEASSGLWHPGRSGSLRLGPKTVLAEFGELHPSLAKKLDIDGPVAAAEIYLDAIPAKRGTDRMRTAFTPPVLQAVTRDYAFVAKADLAADALLRAVRGADKAAITDVALFDVFTGPGLAEDEKSLAIAVTFQPVDKSYAEADLQALSAKVVAAAEKAGAKLRA